MELQISVRIVYGYMDLLLIFFSFAAMIQTVIRATHQPTDFSVLVRAFGRKSEILIDRKQEIIVKYFVKKKGSMC